MTISAISNIALAIGFTELLACIISRKFIFQSKSYTRAVADYEKAKARRDKTVASLAVKHPSQQPKSQKNADRDRKKLEWENKEVSSLAAEIAKRHTQAGVCQSVAFLILYRILAVEYAGNIVALLPFQPFKLLQRMTFRGFTNMTVSEVQSLWMEQSHGGPDATIPGDMGPVHPHVSSASQACSLAFIYFLCSFSIKAIVQKAFGTKPPPGADDYVGSVIDAPQGQKMLQNFGLNAEEVKDARKVLGY
ncbi:hypothetical protein ACHAWU_007941 [Discostella pseudostelligera]|uniref:Calcium load-activated calcium channel n=1 Tax=Discostella pseudostelligera TaxID=259834 RepID=A0ABD3M4B3_9STRA